MWQRFTEHARKVVFYAQEEAGRLGQNSVDTEHLFLGIARVPNAAGTQILSRLGIGLSDIRLKVEAVPRTGEGRPGCDVHLAPGARRVIDLSFDESRRSDAEHIGTEHMLTALARDDNGLGGRILRDLGVTVDIVRNEAAVLKTVEPAPIASESEPPRVLRGVRRGPIRLKSLERHDAPLHTEIEAARRLASMQGESMVTPVHLAVVLLSDPNETVIRILGQYGLYAHMLLVQLAEPRSASTAFMSDDVATDRTAVPALSPAAGSMLVRALEKAHGLMNEEVVGREHLLLAMLEEPSIAPLLTEFGIEPYGVLLELLRLRERGL
ncbi:MAG: Clp protease N-terminal domain-containing protein [Capsulimonadaceae bacterium]